ncbi:MAG: hypothetical protein DRN11_04830, partial [Thermoplasmata archaeon]
GKIDDIIIALNTILTSDLLREGFAREIVRRIQEMRKEMDLEMEEKIEVEINIEKEALNEWEEYVKNETRSINILYKREPQGDYVKDWKVGEEKIKIGIRKVR